MNLGRDFGCKSYRKQVENIRHQRKVMLVSGAHDDHVQRLVLVPNVQKKNKGEWFPAVYSFKERKYIPEKNVVAVNPFQFMRHAAF